MKFQKRVAASLLAVITVISLLPSAYAAGGTSVLTSIGHSSTDTVTLSGTARDVTLTVPYTYSKTEVDLTNGLIITWDETAYKSVVAAPASSAVVDGGAVAVTITYNGINDADGSEKSETVYHVQVVRAKKAPADFSGVIYRTVEYPATTSISFGASDFTNLYKQNDGESLGYIVISGSNLVIGTLKYDGSIYDFKKKIYPGDLGKISFDATDYYGTVSYNVNAYGADTGSLVGTAVLTITVYQAPDIKSKLALTAYVGANLSFSASDFTGCCEMYDMSLQSVEITPENTNCGTWYYDGSAISGIAEIPASKIGSLYFDAAAEGTAKFAWRAKNSAGFSGFGSGTVTVVSPKITLCAYYASSLTRGSTWTVSASNFAYSPSSAALKYIKIVTIPLSSDGYLYLTKALARNDTYGYPAISANQALSAGAVIPYDYLQYLRISTKTTSTSSSISFTWTASAESNASSATWADAVPYTVKFVSGGSVSYSTYENVPVTLNMSDFSSAFSSASGYSLSYVLFTLPVKTSGVLYYDYSLSSKSGKAVSGSTKYYAGTSPNISYLSFVPADNYTGTVSIAYKAYNTNGDYFAGTLTITVSSAAGGTVVYTTDKNSDVQLDAADLSDAFFDATGKELSYVRFTLPSSSYGRLYYDYVSSSEYDSTVSASKNYYVYSSSYLSYISFVPYQNYTGKVVISFTGYDKAGSGYSGTLVILVVDSPAGIVSYTSKVNGIACLSGDDFSHEFISVTGSVLSYVTFSLPDKTSGVLYSKYSSKTATGTAVSTTTKYYNGSSPDISDICFVPTKDFVGKVDIKYTVYTASGASYIGKLKINVGQASSGSIGYKTNLNTALTFDAADFYSKYYSNTGGSKLSYVTFSLPSATYGNLYYNYKSSSRYGSLVTAGAKYYVNSSPYISSVTFVPKAGYSGSFSIPYTGYSSDGKSYPGKIYITVGSGEGIVTYKTSSSEPVTFSASDFRTAFTKIADTTLSYVKFSLPPSSSGVLYYGYTSSSGYTSAVSSTTKYYVSTYPYLSNVTFVPKFSFSGSLVINYTAYDTGGNAYSGTVLITVTESSGGAVKYETSMDVPVTLDPDDFNAAFEAEAGSSLSYVTFTLPGKSEGKLYYGYVSDSKYTSEVSASTQYYRSSSPLLSNVTFVPAKNYSGTVSIQYTGYTSAGKSYTGALVIHIKNPFADMSSDYSWAVPAVSYLYNNDIIAGTGDGKFSPGSNMTRGNFILMVYKAFDLSASGSDNFSDVHSGSYYYDAISAAKKIGIAQGSGNKFHPNSAISRQDAMLIIYRMLEILGKSPKAGTMSDLAAYSDADEVSSYAVEAVAALVKAGMITGSNGTLNPNGMTSRAEMAVMLYRAMTL